MNESINEWRPRLSIEITEEQFLALQRLIPHGLRKVIFSYIVDDLISMLEKEPKTIIGAILSRNITLRNILKTKE